VGKHHAAFELKCAMEENNLQKKGSAPQHQPLAGCPRDFGLGDTSAGIRPPQEEFDWESWLSADSATVGLKKSVCTGHPTNFPPPNTHSSNTHFSAVIIAIRVKVISR